MTQFASAFADNHASVPFSIPIVSTELDNLDCNVEDVGKLFASLDDTKRSGPHGLHPLTLISPSAIISPLTTELFSRSLSTGTLPSDCKNSAVQPIPKGGDPSNGDNYRPICLTAVLAKTIEKIVKCGLLHLESKSILTPAQHGFMKGRSCITKLLLSKHEWLQALNQGKSIDVIFIDLNKAFDKVNHAIFLQKLKLCGVGGSLHQWISDFLIGRI